MDKRPGNTRMKHLEEHISRLIEFLEFCDTTELYNRIRAQIDNFSRELLELKHPEAMEKIKEWGEKMLNEEDMWGDGEEELENDLPEKWESKSDSPVWFDEAAKIPMKTWRDLAASTKGTITGNTGPTKEDNYNEKMKFHKVRNFIWAPDEPTKFTFDSEDYSVKYEKTGKKDVICEGICLWQYKAKEVKFNT